ncbi:MAG: sulfatase-like hydrolase/transferase, partial [Planctomycetota bacterium]
MRRSIILVIPLFLLCVFGRPWVTGALASDRPPNILFVLLDDLGKEWVGAYGSETRLTPNADRLAAGGMLFNNA